MNTPWLAARQEENPLVIVNGILLDGTTCTEEEIVVPNDVTSICGFAFWENHMTSVVIPDSVTSIGSYAFSDCGNLKISQFRIRLHFLESQSLRILHG